MSVSEACVQGPDGLGGTCPVLRHQAAFALAPLGPLEQMTFDEGFHRWKDVSEDEQANKKSRHSEIAAANHVQIAAGARFVHEQHHYGAAIQRRNRQKIKDSEEEIEGEENVEENGGKAVRAGVTVPLNELRGRADPEGQSSEEHQSEICSRAGQSHQRGAVRMTACPIGIIGSAREANHPTGKKEETEQREDYHAVGRTANVGNRIK